MHIDQAKNSSKAFYIAYSRCSEQRPVPGGIEAPIVPAVVNGVFSVELGIKTLILLAGEKPSGHNLSKLFGTLDQATQAALIQATGMASARFHSDLATIAKAFVEWRYIYEKPSTSISMEFLGKLAEAVQGVL